MRVLTAGVGRVVVAACALLLVAGGAGAGWAWSRLRTGACVDLPPGDLSITEMASIKRRLDRHERGADEALELTEREVNFILRDALALPVRLGLHGDRLELQFSEPRNGRCTRVEFRGRVHVAEGVAQLAPEYLMVGTLDLSALASVRRWAIRPAHVDGAASEVLAHTAALHVEEGLLHVELNDPGDLW